MSGGFTGLVLPGQAHPPDARPHAGPSATPAELETMGIPVGELIEDTANWTRGCTTPPCTSAEQDSTGHEAASSGGCHDRLVSIRAGISYPCSNYAYGGAASRLVGYPERHANSHDWAPGRIIVSWMLCECQPAAAAREHGPGHLAIYGQAPGCRSVPARQATGAVQRSLPRQPLSASGRPGHPQGRSSSR
jgi:hypothetical protein